MTDESEGSRVHRHPDAADCPEGLPEDEAAAHPPPVRRHAGGFTRCWIEGGGGERGAQPRRRGGRHAGGAAGAVPSEFGPLLPRLAAADRTPPGPPQTGDRERDVPGTEARDGCSSGHGSGHGGSRLGGASSRRSPCPPSRPPAVREGAGTPGTHPLPPGPDAGTGRAFVFQDWKTLCRALAGEPQLMALAQTVKLPSAARSRGSHLRLHSPCEGFPLCRALAGEPGKEDHAGPSVPGRDRPGHARTAPNPALRRQRHDPGPPPGRRSCAHGTAARHDRAFAHRRSGWRELLNAPMCTNCALDTAMHHRQTLSGNRAMDLLSAA